MSYLTDISSGIGGLDKWQSVGLAVMCANSMSPMVPRFAQPATSRAFLQGLDCAWKSVHDSAVNSLTLSARATLNDLPESTCDDSNSPAYEVMIALSVLAYTLDAIIDDKPGPSVTDACTAAKDHYSGYDNVLARGNQPRRVDPGNTPPPGHLESLQIQSQLLSIQVLKSTDESRTDVIEKLKTIAMQLASEVDSVLPSIAEKRGWTIHLQ